MLTTLLHINKEDLFIVWSCYILGNRKFLVGAKNTDNYFEVTYNYDKNEWYVDEYTRVKNKKISNIDLDEYTERNN